jgi:hypothetical protein
MPRANARGLADDLSLAGTSFKIDANIETGGRVNLRRPPPESNTEFSTHAAPWLALPSPCRIDRPISTTLAHSMSGPSA